MCRHPIFHTFDHPISTRIGASGSPRHLSIYQLIYIYIYTELPLSIDIHIIKNHTSPPLARLPRHGVGQRRVELELVQLLGAGEHLRRQLDGG